MNDPTDPLSTGARDLLKHDAKEQGGTYRKLVIAEGDGQPDVLDRLLLASPSSVLTRRPDDIEEAQCLLAALWLRHDYLNEAHELCQAVETPTGSWWHAILHRREGDFFNAKYWYARAAGHPAMAMVAAAMGNAVGGLPADKSLLRIVSPSYNGAALVDLVQRVHKNQADPQYDLAVTLQLMEWQTLFDYGVRMAR